MLRCFYKCDPRSVFLVLLGLGLAACGADGGRAGEPSACNGSQALCGLRFDQVAYATTHNAMSNEEEGWLLPNQGFGIERQLADGVRALMLDVHLWDDQVMLCHSYCEVQGSSVGQRPLVDALVAVRDFLIQNPGEVVGLIFESYVPAVQVAAAFDQAGLGDMLYAHPVAETWPTLGALIESGTRLVVFTDAPGGPAWYHDVWDHAFETDWDVARIEDLSCEQRRGASGNALFILNHFITAPVASEQAATQANAHGVLSPRAQACAQHWGRPANFITVDFYSRGDLAAVVAELNLIVPRGEPL